MSSMLAVLLCIGLASDAPAATNSCTSGFWSTTLRCRALDVAGLTDPPQPNESSAPPGAAAVKEYTRVFLPTTRVRCVDGTRPVLYVDAAVCATPGGCAQPGGGTAPYGADMVSDKWLISVTGGGACNASDSDGDGTLDDGTRCTDLYPGEASEMSSALDAPMKNLTSAPGGSSGIMSPDPAENPVFAAYNRVRVEKCSYDRYLGRATHKNVAGDLLGTPITYTLYNHGQRIMESALKTLKRGLAYTTWAPGPGGTVIPVAAQLPPLADATHVVFVGHSGGAHGLYHNIDRLADAVRRAAGDDADVRAVFDANFVPAIENEAAFATDVPGGAPLGGDIYTHQWIGASLDSAGGAFTYDGAGFHDASWFGQQQISWKTRLDASCLRAHPADEHWMCRDRYHVLLNHVATPLFFREDFTDPNSEHTDGGDGHPIPWALPGTCAYPDLLALPGCGAPRFTAATQHRARLEEQATRFLSDFDTRSELATQSDASVPAGVLPTLYGWMPSCGSHTGAYGDASYHDTAIRDEGTLEVVDMRQWLEAFVAAPATGQVAWKIDGAVLGTTMTSLCPP